MDQKKDRHGKGRLPEMAPLANPYVPFQLDDPPKYEARKGLVRGTLYPGLDLPFMGMVNGKEKSVTVSTELQVLGFAVQELALYLDTHPKDKEALELYRAYQKALRNAVDEFGKRKGPLNHMEQCDADTYTWAEDPWPWEYVGNKEG